MDFVEVPDLNRDAGRPGLCVRERNRADSEYITNCLSKSLNLPRVNRAQANSWPIC